MVGSYHTVNAYPAKRWWWPGAVALVFIFALVLLPLLALFTYIDLSRLTEPFQNPYLRRVIRFSLVQAFLSTVLAVGLAIPVSLALARRSRFRGRALLLNLFSVALVIPTVLAVFGIVAVYGRTGWLVQLLESLGVYTQWSIYGLTGILLAHVFFNLPLCTRIFLQALNSIPPSHWRTSAQLGMGARSRFTLLEWPAIKSQIIGVVLIVFSLCFTSFAIVMTLGGGPRATTIEVAIYQALRFDFDLVAAVSLAVVQLCLCALLVLVCQFSRVETDLKLLPAKSPERYGKDYRWQRWLDFALITLALLFVITPLLALLVAAINPVLVKVIFNGLTLKALINTVGVAIVSGAVSVLLASLLLISVRHLKIRLGFQRVGKLLESTGLMILIAPPVVIGTGLFLLLRPVADVFSLALLLVMLVNAVMSLPFVLRVLSVPFNESARQYDRLCVSLGVLSWRRLTLIEWPLLRRPLGLSMALATTFSAGDLTVIALFGSERVMTLPLLLYQRMGSYRMQEAAVTALLLLLTCLVLFWLLDRVIGGRRQVSKDIAHQAAINA
ncbi:MAG: thiamine/thiamine pyrophosphate ABC transporter permease [Granulosicoccus sp.]|nr:thiamine/thiamine pyrophosphate ABC transporter permease [Granulosicoccus sp.]